MRDSDHAESGSSPSRLYLDHAATSWPKAAGVTKAMTDFLTHGGASSSRGNYGSAQRSDQIVRSLRNLVATSLDAESDACISFHSGCTAALNAIIHGLIGPDQHVQRGSHCLVSAIEHNAVRRPIVAAARMVDAAVEEIPCDSAGRLQTGEVLQRIQDHTRLVAISHISNVTGSLQPIDEIGSEIERVNRSRSPEQKIFFLCDAAQSFGYLPVSATLSHAHAIAVPAHKGCGGPPGIGALYLHSDWHNIIGTWMQGGTGNRSLDDDMPKSMPDKLEAGTMNLPAMAGWIAALQSPTSTPLTRSNSDSDQTESDESKLSRLSQQLHNSLRSIEGIRVIGNAGPLPIASIDFGPELPPNDAAAILDAEFGIEVRSGHHCAGRIHHHLGTESTGTVRLSGGHGTTSDDIARAVDAVSEIARQLRGLDC
ncbi:aminotransferase class V-fold PLP-dependent enzyme [Rhodopirellula sp. JC740]|uniref:Aminotransferase class V-fold PLP-dependent enzyme n=1 Tax=Rhodopirellula halodulae TaxID=2894198 RepID=A0ABS8NMZ8_9BACT|nr:aminotransferase class V-fold PLP-dependent enzyme [Rhodopirellula sp. JC740]MCC9644880.1 aminotransferase class V-fold PLP-dependent enzyme [Rhodopirellula sp. JC740]